MNIEIILILLAAGSLAGFTAGLYGIGGGLVVIPVCLWVLQHLGIETEHVQQLAIGTSFTVMLFTTAVSSWVQHKQGAVNKQIIIPMAPGIIAGTLLGAYLASYIPSRELQMVFIVFAFALAVKTFVGFSVKGTEAKINKGFVFSVGGLIGSLSSLLGIGGGVFNVPFMLSRGIQAKEAVGTSAVLSWVVAVFGTISYLISGWNLENLPEASIGFCYLPVAISLAVTTMIFAPLGVKLSHKVPAKFLQYSFAVLVAFVSVKLLLTWLENA